MTSINKNAHNGIPISVSLEENVSGDENASRYSSEKKRLIFISLCAIVTGLLVSIIAKLLVLLINLITNISFHLTLSAASSNPAGNSYGLLVIFVPVIGGLLVGLMAFYGSKAIRGHGIPEAMEQILKNKSRIRPSVTYLKPLASAISIGTGGPFGAEGPIIATGGALGSTAGQLLKISHYERKVLLAAGATAGMSAIFGSPLAAIFLAIELLLFEFSPRSIIPVALACITGTAGHFLLFEPEPVFKMAAIAAPGNMALGIYSGIGLITGLVSAIITKAVYLIEDYFEKLPVHWMWWPALGGIVVGTTGYFAPMTLGVGYDNITGILSGKLLLSFVVSLCILKLISWSVALGSGTSGGTLAPLLTIGGAFGYLAGAGAIYLFPQAGITIPLAALIGMSAMFAGASRALLTSILFAMETTGQVHALLPLLAACTGSYIVSFLLMKNTIMTEKIARRGVKTPYIYEPDILDKITVGEVIREEGIVLSIDNTIEEARNWISKNKHEQYNYYILTTNEGVFRGIISSSNIFSMHHPVHQLVGGLIKRNSITVNKENNLKMAVEIMAKENVDVLPVVSARDNKIIGILSYKDVLSCYTHKMDEQQKGITISIKRRALKILVHGRKKLRYFEDNS